MSTAHETRTLRQNYKTLKALALMVDPIARCPALQELPPTDVRRIALGDLRKTFATYAALLHALYWNRTAVGVETALSVVDCEGDSVLDMVDDVVRASVFDAVFTTLDSLFRNLTRAIPKLQEEKWFGKNATRWMARAALTEQERKINALLTIAIISNSRHNGGFHLGKSFATVIRGKTFQFVRNRPVQCADWDHLEIVLAEAIEALEEFLVSPYVRSIPFTEGRYVCVPTGTGRHTAELPEVDPDEPGQTGEEE
jgi:hypothetical protein